MVKQGKDRSAKFSAKHDPKVIMYRIKAIQEKMKAKFPVPSEQAFYVDENVRLWLQEFPLDYGQKASLLDLVKELVWKWPTLTDADKAVYYAKWIEKGLPEEIWLRMAFKNNEVLSVTKTRLAHNLMVSFEADVFPYPEEYINPILEDYVQSKEILPLPIEVYTQDVWRQKTDKYGDVDYLCVWSALGMNKTLGIDLIIETVQPLLFEKTLQINCFIDTPYQSPLDRSASISTSHETESGEDKGQDETEELESANENTVLASPVVSSSINISYDTQVT